MAQISWTKKSLKDLRAINDYISLDSSFYAVRFISKLISRVDQLIEFPESGRMVPEKILIFFLRKVSIWLKKSNFYAFKMV